MKYLIRLNDYGYFNYNSRYKPVSKLLASVLSNKEANKNLSALKKLGYNQAFIERKL